MRSAAWLLADASLPIWSCSVWGLPCPRRYRRSGALLPHHFTLTPARTSLRASHELFRGSPHRRRGVAEAVSFLWHWPSAGLEARIPDVIRHTALRSSDFPPPAIHACADAPAATARSSCQLLVYRETRARRFWALLPFHLHVPDSNSPSTFTISLRRSGRSTCTESQIIAVLTAKYPCATRFLIP